MCKQTFPGHESDINAVTVSALKHETPVNSFLDQILIFSSFQMVLHLQLVLMMQLVGCSTSELIRN